MGSCEEPSDIIERETLCFSRPQPGMVVHGGQHGFTEHLMRLYTRDESNAAERLVKLKDCLRKTDSESFWPLLTEGLASITDAQYAFVSKRILTCDDGHAVEMPPIGEPGACLMGAAFYVNDGHGNKQQLRNFKYHAYSCPCAYMRHDKIFIIPEQLNDFILDNPNKLALPVPGEAYLGIPLFVDGKCFAHFGVMWSAEGAARRKLGWGYLEMLFHSLEDLILARVLEGRTFAESTAPPLNEVTPKVIPHEAISMAQSLQPYARSLSHELRTPMQGVVGMLDVMMANVKEAAEGLNEPRIMRVLESLKENIETVQDSSRRAVEAADNVVHAYDMNMGVPETPLTPLDRLADDNVFLRDKHPDIVVTGNNIPINPFRGANRRREELWRCGGGDPASAQARVARMPRRRIRHSPSEEPPAKRQKSATLGRATRNGDTLEKSCSHEASDAPCDSDSSSSPLFASEHSIVPGLRHTDMRELIRYVINDALKVGGRPESAIAEATEFGERIEVRTRRSSGQVNTKFIEWMVADDVPETILIDEKDLAKTVSCVVLNAIKFTDNGNITLKVALSEQGRYIVINVKDTGSGIPAAFLPNLFKPFAREDNSTTRESEGLGLGLLVARGLARRKLGGDLYCIHSDVSGPQKGSEFEMRVPLTPGEVCSRSASPFGSPTPSVRSRTLGDEVPSPPGIQPTTTPPLSSDPVKGDNRTQSRDSPVTSAPTLHQLGIPVPSPRSVSPVRPRARTKAFSDDNFDRKLASRYPLNILVVEDNKINRRLLVQMLAKLGYTNVSEAYDGNNAIEQVLKERPGQDQIDVVLMDLWMPLLDGFQAADAIGKMNLPKTPKILAVSADVTQSAFTRATNVGMKGFLYKPFQLRHLEKLIVDTATSAA